MQKSKPLKYHEIIWSDHCVKIPSRSVDDITHDIVYDKYQSNLKETSYIMW